MKKKVTIVLIGMMSLSLISCSKDKELDTVVDTVIEETGTSEGEENTLIEGEKIDETVEIDSENIEQNVVEKALPLTSEEIDYDIESLLQIEGAMVDDAAFLARIEKYMSTLYYNYFFPKSIPETGYVKGKSMEVFALSHIMQYDQEGLNFDYSTYELKIPSAKVAEVVETYFQRELDIHNSYDGFRVIYNVEQDMYAVRVEDDVWDVDIVLKEIRQLNSTMYRVLCDLSRREDQVVEEQVEAIITMENETPVVIYYKTRAVEVVTEE